MVSHLENTYKIKNKVNIQEKGKGKKFIRNYFDSTKGWVDRAIESAEERQKTDEGVHRNRHSERKVYTQ